jgi:SepF-like predicted cell division protein (DUF552 family)
MAKRYKLIKKYPNSVDIGDIVEFDKMANQYRLVALTKRHFFGKDVIENQPEFWQEIVELPEYVECVDKYSDFSPYTVGKIYKLIEGWLISDYGNKTVLYTYSSSTFKPSTKEAYDLQELKKKFIVGKWYKSERMYTKFTHISDINLFYGSEHIYNNNYVSRTNDFTWVFPFRNDIVEATLEEIQQYLPEEHPDKIKVEVKKNWEIVSVINDNNGLIITYNSQGIAINRSDDNKSLCVTKSLNIALQNDFFEIHSVKRLSDNEIFTLNQQISYRNSKYRINKFRIETYGMFCDLNDNITGCNINMIELSKVEEEWVPKVGDWVVITQNGFTHYGTVKLEREYTKDKTDYSYGYFYVTGDQLFKAHQFRKALPHEIPVESKKSSDLDLNISLNDVKIALTVEDEYNDILEHLRKVIKQREKDNKNNG